MGPLLRPARITALFAAFGALWVVGSTGFAGRLLEAEGAYVRVEMLKGLGYVAASALMLYLLLRKVWKRLQGEREWHDALFNRHPFPMGIYEPGTLRFLAVNDAALKQYGYTRGEFLGLSLGDIRHPDDMGSAPTLSSHAEVMPRRSLVRHLRKDGTVFDAEVRSESILYKGRRVFLGIAENVTERLEAEELVRATVKGSPLGLITTDFEGRIVSWNASSERIFGWKAAETIGKPMPGTASLSPAVRAALWDRVRAGETLTGVEATRTRKDGSTIDVRFSAAPLLDAYGGVRGVLSVVEDISARVETERSLQRHQALLHIASRISRTGAWVLERDASLTWSEQVHALHEVPPGFKPDRENTLAFYVPEHRPVLEAALAKCFENGTPFDEELEIVTARGKRIWVRTMGEAERGGDGAVARIQGAIQDISEHKSVVRSLAQSALRFRELADAMPLMVWTADRNGRLDFANRAFTEYTGIPSDETLGDRWTDAVHPSGLQEGLSAWNEAVVEGKPHEKELLFFRASDRTYRWHILRAEPVRDENGKVVKWYGTATEIHESRKMQRRLATLLDNLPGMAYRCRLDHDWTMLFVSQGSSALTGYPPEDLVQNARIAFGDLVHPEDQERIYREVMEAVEKGQTFELEYRIRTRDGEIRRVWERGRFFSHPEGGRLEGFIMDVTARKVAEDERERLLAAIEQMGEMLLITDARGAIQYVNPAFERVTGWSRTEIRGRNPRILKSGVQDATFYHEMWRTLVSGRTWRGRLVNKRRDGTLFTEEALISPVLDQTGKIVNYVGVKNDISRQLTLEEQYRQAQKMEAVGRLAGGIAHDFNNMLTVILMRSEMGILKVDAGHPLRSLLLEIHEAAERSAALTRQLLTYARRQAVEPRVIDPNAVMEGMLQMLRRLMGENIELAWIPGESVWPVKIDPVQVDQLLANLCVNARDAIEDVGKVTIETLNVTLSPENCLDKPGHVPGDFVRIAVGDTGSGMDPEVLSHLFEPFFTTKEVGKGTGLGLATVYGIVKQNNGFIDVYSEPGDGTVFKVYLPRHAESLEKAAVEIGKPAPRARGEHILLVEDEPMILSATAEILQDMGYRVIPCGGPDEALVKAGAPEAPIDLVLTDVIMPGMNGRDLLVKLRERRPELKVLFMSGYTANVVVHRGLAGDAEYFIQKPFTAEALALKVRQVLEAPPAPV
jgi:PAS domain S-box-containing protein